MSNNKIVKPPVKQPTGNCRYAPSHHKIRRWDGSFAASKEEIEALMSINTRVSISDLIRRTR